MPKLDDTHTIDRLRRRLEELEQGVEVAAKDFRAVLTDEQHDAYERAWEEQQELRKKKRARTKEEEKELGWKSKREVRIETLKAALNEAWDNSEEAWDKKLYDLELRQARIYLDSVNKALDEGKDLRMAQSFANNELTRAGLRRLDGQNINSMSRRDLEVQRSEALIIARIRSNKSEEELQQIALSEGIELEALKKDIKRVLAEHGEKWPKSWGL
jgi:catalase (peroxidase I)